MKQVNEKDWKLFRSRLPGWQEAYMGKLIEECATVKKHSGDCHKKTVRKRWIEDLVVEELMSFLRDDRTEDAIVDCVMRIQEAENKALPLLEQQLREAETGIENMLRAIQQGVLTKSTRHGWRSWRLPKNGWNLKSRRKRSATPCSRPSLSIAGYSASASWTRSSPPTEKR